MSRSGYYDDNDDILAHGRWRAQVRSATYGRRGQKLLKDMLAALDALPEPRLIAGDLVFTGEPQWSHPSPDEDIILGGDQLVDGSGRVVRVGDVCALGALGLARGMDMSKLDPHEAESVADAFDIAHQLAREIVYENDEGGYSETPEQRFIRIRRWVERQIKPE